MQRFRSNVSRKLRMLFSRQPTPPVPADNVATRFAPDRDGVAEAEMSREAITQLDAEHQALTFLAQPPPHSSVEDASTNESVILHQSAEHPAQEEPLGASLEVQAEEADVVTTANGDYDRTSEQLQFIRESNYLVSDGKAENGYTSGPSRVVFATDGVEECPALLVTMSLSQAVQQVNKTQRAFDKTHNSTMAKIDALDSLLTSISVEIDSHKLHLSSLEKDDANADQTEKIALEEEVSFLELMLEDYASEHTALSDDLADKWDNLLQAQGELFSVLEESWVAARLIEREQDEPPAPPQQYDLQTEREVFRKKLQNADDAVPEDHADEPLLEDEDDVYANPWLQGFEVEAAIEDNSCWVHSSEYLRDPEVKARMEKKELPNARAALNAAQLDFDMRYYTRQVSEEARHAAIERGEQDDTTSVFDVKCHLWDRKLTRWLIEAEIAYKQAQQTAAAREAAAGGLEEPDTDADDVDGGFNDRSEETLATAAPDARILKWISSLPQASTLCLPEDDAQDAEADHWEVASLNFGDNISDIMLSREAIEGNTLRERIDGWHEMQRQLAAGLCSG